jgi:hypothetical protein
MNSGIGYIWYRLIEYLYGESAWMVYVVLFIVSLLGLLIWSAIRLGEEHRDGSGVEQPTHPKTSPSENTSLLPAKLGLGCAAWLIVIIIVWVGINYRSGEIERKTQEKTQRWLDSMSKASEEARKNSQRQFQARIDEAAKRRSSFPQK